MGQNTRRPGKMKVLGGKRRPLTLDQVVALSVSGAPGGVAVSLDHLCGGHEGLSKLTGPSATHLLLLPK